MTESTEQTKQAPHWMDCNCECHGFDDNTGENCPHCMPELYPDYSEQKELPLDAIYRILNSLVKRLGDTRWGSAAFDIELGNTRHELYKLVQESEVRVRSHLILGIEEKFCFNEPMPTHINDRKLTQKAPFINYLQGRDSIRKDLKKYLTALQKIK